jgi:hypothetical protein
MKKDFRLGFHNSLTAEHVTCRIKGVAGERIGYESEDGREGRKSESNRLIAGFNVEYFGNSVKFFASDF